MRSRVATSSVASAVTVSWKTGACQASVSRRAIVRRVDVSSTTSTSGGDAGAAAAGSDRCLLDVLRDDAALGPGADDLREVDASLAGDSPRERARLHVLAGCSGGADGAAARRSPRRHGSLSRSCTRAA